MNTAQIETVFVTREDVTLSGTLVRPVNPGGVVIFVHGSGPLDRDSNGPGAQLNIFNALAQVVCDAGYASIRYDKRGIAASGGDYATLRQADLVADILAWIDYCEGNGLGPVILCGHSEGTDLVARAALAHDVAGLMLLCPYVMPGREILIEQARKGDVALSQMPGWRGFVARCIARVIGWPSQRQARFIAKMQASDAPEMKVGKQKINVRWLRDFSASAPEAGHRANQRPTLVLSALLDVQCPPQDGATIAAMNPKSTLVEVPDVSHILRPTRTPGVADYPGQLAKPIDSRVSQAIAQWLAGFDPG